MSDLPAIDDSRLASIRSTGGEALVRKLAALYLTHTAGRMKALLGASRADDLSTVAAEAHAIRSSSGQIGAQQVHNLMGALEEAAGAGRADQSRELVASAQQAFTGACDALRRLTAGARRVVVVDDVPDNRLLVSATLEERFDVAEYADGPSALAALSQDPPAVVLLDIALPGMDGFEVLRRLREQPSTARVPVVALTAHAMGGDRERYLAAGFAAYVAKPITDLAALLSLVEQLAARD